MTRTAKINLRVIKHDDNALVGVHGHDRRLLSQAMFPIGQDPHYFRNGLGKAEGRHAGLVLCNQINPEPWVGLIKQ